MPVPMLKYCLLQANILLFPSSIRLSRLVASSARPSFDRIASPPFLCLFSPSPLIVFGFQPIFSIFRCSVTICSSPPARQSTGGGVPKFRVFKPHSPRLPLLLPRIPQLSSPLLRESVPSRFHPVPPLHNIVRHALRRFSRLEISLSPSAVWFSMRFHPFPAGTAGRNSRTFFLKRQVGLRPCDGAISEAIWHSFCVFRKIFP